ncbi:hypothetical protein CN128_07480 [Sinorhizobium meliloti]|uniref:hypothetical protein n=1 Tax=Rhizobium meliloti TaxID=382 RepID=UPI000FDA3489|nr:hypothetical protein [Sinorhizobium meliloti]RVM58881.1 hypothetical protein CN128_07480 [Sinorhizobium meliloti]
MSNTTTIGRYIVSVSNLRVDNTDPEEMVLATLTVNDNEYDCAEYIGDGEVNNTADSHIANCGVYNRTRRGRDALVEIGETDPNETKAWMQIEAFLRSSMQAFVDETFKQAA